MHATEWFFVCHVVHEDEAHGAAVVGGGDGTVPLLTSSILKNAIFEGTEEDALFYQSWPACKTFQFNLCTKLHLDDLDDDVMHRCYPLKYIPYIASFTI